MSERKVLNKYYPPDFDPTKIPKLKGPRNKTFNIRVMAPFNMRCNTCGEYIYKGKKFNSRKETVEDEDYLGLQIHRFYIKCPRCVAEIAFKTDPENTDYTCEAGATRNFEAAKTAMAMAIKEQKEKEDEEANNPMKVLENRTKASRNEMERIENLEELREMNTRHAKVDHQTMIKLHAAYEEQLSKLQDEEDERIVEQAFGKGITKRLIDDDESDSDDGQTWSKIPRSEKPTDILVQASVPVKPPTTAKPKSLRDLVKPKKSSLAGLIVKKKSPEETPENKAASENVQFSEISNTKAKVFEPNNVAPAMKNSRSQEVTVESGTVVSQAKGALSLLSGTYSDSDESES